MTVGEPQPGGCRVRGLGSFFVLYQYKQSSAWCDSTVVWVVIQITLSIAQTLPPSNSQGSGLGFFRRAPMRATNSAALRLKPYLLMGPGQPTHSHSIAIPKPRLRHDWLNCRGLRHHRPMRRSCWPCCFRVELRWHASGRQHPKGQVATWNGNYETQMWLVG